METLSDIAAREAAATPGPWAWRSFGEKCYAYSVGVYCDDKDQPIGGEIVDRYEADSPDTYKAPVEIESICESHEQSGRADCEFIAHARTDIPWLLAEISRLTAAVDTERERENAGFRGRETEMYERGRLSGLDDGYRDGIEAAAKVLEYRAALLEREATQKGLDFNVRLIRQARQAESEDGAAAIRTLKGGDQ